MANIFTTLIKAGWGLANLWTVLIKAGWYLANALRKMMIDGDREGEHGDDLLDKAYAHMRRIDFYGA